VVANCSTVLGHITLSWKCYIEMDGSYIPAVQEVKSEVGSFIIQGLLYNE